MQDDNTSEDTKILLRPHIYNQLTKLAIDREFTDFLDRQRGILGPYGTIKGIASCRSAIKKFLNKKRVPLAWCETVLSLIKDGELNLPLNNAISLKVCGEELHDRTQKILIIRDEHGNIVGDSTINIVITANVSTEEIIRFIKENCREIEFWQKQLGLPEYRRLNWKDIDRALEIIRMKDEDKLTFSEIAEYYSSRDDLTQGERDMLCGEAYIKKIYYRFKKRLQIG